MEVHWFSTLYLTNTSPFTLFINGKSLFPLEICVATNGGRNVFTVATHRQNLQSSNRKKLQKNSFSNSVRCNTRNPEVTEFPEESFSSSASVCGSNFSRLTYLSKQSSLFVFVITGTSN